MTEPFEDDLLTTAQALWPGSSLSVDGQSSAGGTVRARYAVVPSLRDPRILVPLDPPRARGASLRRLSAASTWGESALRVSAAVVARAMPRGLLRHRIEIRGGTEGLDDYLAALFGHSVRFSISIGSRRVNRKPVLQIFDEAGRSLAFAKLGTTATSAADVTAESAALAQVAGRRFQRLIAPRVIATGDWHGQPILVIDALQVPSIQPPDLRGAVTEAAMAELCRAFAEPPAPLSSTPWWLRQWETAAGLEDATTRTRLARCLSRVVTLAGRRDLRWGAWHGDWTPWNMARIRGAVLLWDRERFETGVPGGLDRIHYVVNTDTVRAGGSPSSLLAGIQRAQGDLTRGSDAHLAGLLYLVAVAGRYLPLVSTPLGADIAPRADDTLAALEILSAA